MTRNKNKRKKLQVRNISHQSIIFRICKRKLEKKSCNSIQNVMIFSNLENDLWQEIFDKLLQDEHVSWSFCYDFQVTPATGSTAFSPFGQQIQKLYTNWVTFNFLENLLSCLSDFTPVVSLHCEIRTICSSELMRQLPL